METKQTAVMAMANAFREWQKEWDSYKGTNQPKSFDEFIEPFLQMEKEQSHKYAEFAIRCDRKDMKILNFEDFIKL